MSKHAAEHEPDHPADLARRAEVVEAIRAAHKELASVSELDALPKILAGLTQAEEDLTVGSECRMSRPYAPIIQVGDEHGLHYECTHSPPHIF